MTSFQRCDGSFARRCGLSFAPTVESFWTKRRASAEGSARQRCWTICLNILSSRGLLGHQHCLQQYLAGAQRWKLNCSNLRKRRCPPASGARRSSARCAVPAEHPLGEVAASVGGCIIGICGCLRGNLAGWPPRTRAPRVNRAGFSIQLASGAGAHPSDHARRLAGSRPSSPMLWLAFVRSDAYCPLASSPWPRLTAATVGPSSYRARAIGRPSARTILPRPAAGSYRMWTGTSISSAGGGGGGA